MMDIITSEFAWGTILGVFLSIVTSYAQTKFNQSNMKVIVKDLLNDTVSNISEYIDNLNDHRSRARVIHNDFLSLIEGELAVYSRNREHTLHISNNSIRKEVRNYFANIGIKLSVIRQNLNAFNDLYRQSQSLEASNPDEARRLSGFADAALSAAHKECDNLVAIKATSAELQRKLGHRKV